MKKLLYTGAFILGLGVAGFTIGGCTSQQIQTVETDLASVLQVAVDAVDALQNNPQAIAGAEAALSSLAAVAPQTGPVHQAIVDAQAALNALQSNPNALPQAQAALQKVIGLLEGQGTIPLGRVIHHTATK